MLLSVDNDVSYMIHMHVIRVLSRKFVGGGGEGGSFEQ